MTDFEVLGREARGDDWKRLVNRDPLAPRVRRQGTEDMKRCKRGHRYPEHRRQCPECHREKCQRWRVDHPGYHKQWETANIDKRRQQKRERMYGLTIRRFNLLWRQQAGGCAICRTPMTIGGNGPDSCCVDHDHYTGEVRGLACKQCNTGLGLFRDDPVLMQAATDYLTEKKRVL